MRAAILGVLLALSLAVPACDDAGDSPPPAEEASPDFGPTAAYNRRLLFLGPDGPLPATAVFDFAALSDSIGIRRGVRVRIGDGTAWQTLLDQGWEMDAMREPWRLVPHGPLTMVVGETGELVALVHRDSVATRLELGQTLAEHSPDVGTQLVLRAARLTRAGDTIPGVVLDAQLGRAVNPAVAMRDTTRPHGDTVADTATIPATPIALPGAEALLLDEEGYSAVVATASSGSLAWVRNAGRSDVRSGVRLEATTWSAAGGEARVPTAWRIVSTSGDITGELTARAVDANALQGPGLQALAYAQVTGWIEDRMVRRDVFGLVRHVR